MALPSEVSLLEVGRYSAYPEAESRWGMNPYCWISKRIVAVALVVDKSQFDENRALWIGMLSVCPSMRRSLLACRKTNARRANAPAELALIWSDPLSKNPTSRRPFRTRNSSSSVFPIGRLEGTPVLDSPPTSAGFGGSDPRC